MTYYYNGKRYNEGEKCDVHLEYNEEKLCDEIGEAEHLLQTALDDWGRPLASIVDALGRLTARYFGVKP